MYDDLEGAGSPAAASGVPTDQQRRQRERLVRRLDAASARSRRPSLTARLGLGLASAVPGMLAVFVGVVASLIWRTFYGSASGSAIGWTAATRQVDWLPVLVVAALVCGACAVTFSAGRLLYVPTLIGLLMGASEQYVQAPWAGKGPAAIYQGLGHVEGFWGQWLAYAAILHVVVIVVILHRIRRPLRPFRS